MSANAIITVYEAICGWKAVLMVRTNGCWEPEITSYFGHPTKEEAVDYARDWARDEEIKLDRALERR